MHQFSAHPYLPLRQVVAWSKSTKDDLENETLQRAIVETANSDLIQVLYYPDESIEDKVCRVMGSRIEHSSSFPLDADSILGEWASFGWELPEITYKATAEKLHDFLARLTIPQGPIPITSAQYNFLRHASPYRRQAINAYPWLLDALSDRLITVPKYSVVDILQAIDAGEELNPVLARMFGTRVSVIHRMHCLPREILSKPDLMYSYNLLEGLAPMAQTLACLAPQMVPKSGNEWKWLRYVVHWTRRILNGRFRAEVAANVYRSLPTPDSGATVLTRLGHRPDEDVIGNLRSHLLFATHFRLVRDSDNSFQDAETCLADRIIEWLLEHRSPRWLLRMYDRLQRCEAASAVLCTPRAVAIPHLPVELARGKSEAYRIVCPIKTVQQMIDEGKEMNNCMGRMWNWALFGKVGYYFSVRDGQGRMQAHVEISINTEGFSIQCIKGMTNADVDPHTSQAVEALVTELAATPPNPVRPNLDSTSIEIAAKWMDVKGLIDNVVTDYRLEIVPADQDRLQILNTC